MANFQKVPGDNTTRFEPAQHKLILMLNETVRIDLLGVGPHGESLVVDAVDNNVATVSSEPVARKGNLFTYTVTGLKTGNTSVEARLMNQSAADYQSQRGIWKNRPTSASLQVSILGAEYRQAESTWGNLKYGSTNARWKNVKWTTMAEAGCGPTSLAIVLDYLDRLNSPDRDVPACFPGVDPSNTMKYTSTYGRAADKNDKPAGTAGSVMMANLSKQYPDYEAEDVYDLKHAANFLKAGTPLVFLCQNCTSYKYVSGQKKTTTFPGHFMVLVGVENDEKTFWISDPSLAKTTHISSTELQGSSIWRVYRKTPVPPKNPLLQSQSRGM